MATRENNWYENIETNWKLDAGQKLLVPMSLRALVVTNAIEGPWKYIIPDYKRFNNKAPRGVGKFLEEEIAGTIHNSTTAPPKGIHLHWILPKAFRHGIQKKDAPSPDFPPLPNRWLITRMHIDGDKINTKHWIVESDYVNDIGKNRNYFLIDKKPPEQTLTTNDSFKTAKIGRTIDADKWSETLTSPIQLTVLAPGDPGFIASYDSCKGIYGFYDDLKSISETADNCSYTVSGWYADPKNNILWAVNATKWLENMKSFSWQIKGFNTSGDIHLPVGVLCHAMIYGVPCSKNINARLNNIPNVDSIKASIGNTTAEALAPLIVDNITKESLYPTLDPFLSAFQYKLITEHGNDKGLNHLKKQIHDNGFHPDDGGLLWTLENKEKKSGPQVKSSAADKTPKYLPFPSEVSGLLAELNHLQHKYDKYSEINVSLREQLYCIWYLNQTSGAGDQDQLKGETIGKLKTETRDILDKLDRNKTILNSEAISKKKDELTTALRNHPDLNLELKELKMPTYYLPNEPAIVINGLKPARGFDEEGNLECRLSTQLINTISFSNPLSSPSKIIVPAAALIKTPLLSNADIPKEAVLLLQEAMLLDPASNHLKAIVASDIMGGESSDARTRLLEDNISAYLKNPNSVFQGARQPPLFAVAEWEQPWNPLYMEWEVEWISSYDSLTTDKVFAGWKYDPSIHDYTKVKSTLPPSTNAKNSYVGRVFLSPDLSGKVSELYKSIAALKNVSYADFQPMSQTLSGINHNFVALETGLQLPPLVKQGDTYSVDRIISDIRDEYLWRPSLGKENKFLPVRCGYFKIRSLFVIDSFGRLLPVIYENANSSCQLVSANIDHLINNDQLYISAPPRIAHPARLRFNWISAEDDLRETDSDPGTAPVCGWLLPNNLDKSLMAFDKDGEEIGELRIDIDGSKVLWSNPPGKKKNLELNTLDHALGSVISSIRNFDGASFKELYNIIDGKSKNGLPKSHFRQLSMELPIGIPIAIAKASCFLEIKGLPPRDWVRLTNDDAFNAIEFPVFLGNASDPGDGLIGFFNNAYEKINAPFSYQSTGDFLISGSNLQVNIMNNENPAAAEPLVLLIDPRLPVTLACGILPQAQYELPAFGISKIMEKINFSFLANPILTTIKKTKIPLPDIKDKEWTFITNHDEEAAEKIQTNSTDTLTFEPLHLMEGWVKLTKKIDQK